MISNGGSGLVSDKSLKKLSNNLINIADAFHRLQQLDNLINSCWDNLWKPELRSQRAAEDLSIFLDLYLAEVSDQMEEMKLAIRKARDVLGHPGD